MSQRTDRVAGEIRAVLSDVLTRQEIKDPRVWDAGLITITGVQVSGDLRHARVLFLLHQAPAERSEKVCEGLQAAAGFLRHRLGKVLHTRVVPELTFAVDSAFDKAERVEAILRDLEDGGGPDRKP